MASTLLNFLGTPQAYPDKRDAAARARDFREIYEEFQPQKAAIQAGRCSQCGIPFCQVHCPLGNNIPDWLMLTAEGRLQEAYAVSSATNTFPEICGRICPQDKLCEGNCVVEKDFGAITIGAVEKYITDTAWSNGWVAPLRAAQTLPLSVGIIGAGPAGLAAAEVLRRAGASVTVYDRYDRVGGLLMYGIPNFKLEKSVVQRRADWLYDGGIEFTLNTHVDALAFASLRAKHDRLLIATGVYAARNTNALNSSLPGIVAALPYLTASNKSNLGAALADEWNTHGQRVVVIGGGDTAMDCVRTAIRQGAASVTCLYRRDKANMPGSSREVHHAMEEGVTFEWLAQPVAFQGAGRVEAVAAERMQLVTAGRGRAEVAPLANSGFKLPADKVILALGFEPEDYPAQFGQPGLKTRANGTLAVDAGFQTSLPGVYAAGDSVRGASLVVWATKEGRDAAAAMLSEAAQSVRLEQHTAGRR
ncbi:MAG: NAD(P)-dependent oxidoreductase [Alphaproteobacteria bacterium]|nr:NAD(P)-dependent oxidoreductase [Alphaproteobacteria bacterium]